MKLFQLRYFCAVYQYMNITKAAESLYVSQPAVSNAIRDLEEEFGLSLFLRNNNRLDSTQEGDLFYKRCQSLLKSVDNFQKDMHSLANSVEQIRIAVPPMIGAYIVPRLIDFQKNIDQYTPPVRLSIMEFKVPQLLPALEADQIDAIVACNQTLSFHSCHEQLLVSLPFSARVNKDHPLAKKACCRMEELLEYPIFMTKGTSMTRIIQDWFLKSGYHVQFSQTYEQLSTLEQVLLRGTGICLANDAMPLSHQDLVSVPLETPFYADICLFWSKNRPVNTRNLNFFRYLATLPF